MPNMAFATNTFQQPQPPQYFSGAGNNMGAQQFGTNYNAGGQGGNPFNMPDNQQ